MALRSTLPACATLAGLLLVGVLGGSAQPQAAAAAPQTLTIALDGSVQSLDPPNTNDHDSYDVENAIFQGLFRLNNSMSPVPVLATGYQMNSGATSLTVELRKGVSFSDGTPFNAQAVKINLDRDSDAKNPVKKSSLFSMIKDVQVVNPYEVRIDLKYPDAGFISNLAHPSAEMVSPKAIAAYGSKLSSHPVGTGPFEFVSWQDGLQVTVKANPHYWGAKSNVGQIRFDFVPQASTRVAMLKTGQAQLVTNLPADLVSSLQGTSGIMVEHPESNYVWYVSFNVTIKPFTSVLVRQAIAHAINQQVLIRVTQDGMAAPATSPIAPLTVGYEAQTPYQYSVATAKQLLSRAGYPKGFSATMTLNNDANSVEVAQFIQQQLQAIGITLKLEPEDPAIVAQQLSEPQSQNNTAMNLNFWASSTGDADWGLSPLFTKAAFPPVGFNSQFYTNPKVESALAKALTTSNGALRRADYATAQKQIWQDAPCVFLYVPDNIYAYGHGVSGISILASGQLVYGTVHVQ